MDKSIGYPVEYPRSLVLIAGLLLVALLGAFDYATGPEFSLALVYLVPLFLVVRCVSVRAGVAVSLLSAGVMLTSELAWAPQSVSLAPYWNAVARLGFLLVVTYLASSAQVATEKARSEAWSDPVSGAGNARYFLALVANEMNRSAHCRRPFTVASVDVGNVRGVNQEMGHLAGDTLLALVARTCARNLRRMDAIARLGGDEFAILLSEADAAEGRMVSERIHARLTEIFQHDGWPATLCIGAVTFTEPPESPDVVIRAAEEAMCEAKQEGKENVRCAVWPPTAGNNLV